MAPALRPKRRRGKRRRKASVGRDALLVVLAVDLAVPRIFLHGRSGLIIVGTLLGLSLTRRLPLLTRRTLDRSVEDRLDRLEDELRSAVLDGRTRAARTISDEAVELWRQHREALQDIDEASPVDDGRLDEAEARYTDILVIWAEIRLRAGETEAAEEALDDALATYRYLDIEESLIHTLSVLADLYHQTGRPDAAVEALTEGIDRCRYVEDLASEANLVHQRAAARRDLGDLDGADHDLRQALTLARSTGEGALGMAVAAALAGVASAGGHVEPLLRELARPQPRYEDAEALGKHGVETSAGAGNHTALADHLSALAFAYQDWDRTTGSTDHTPLAIGCYQATAQLRLALGQRRDEAEALRRAADASERDGHHMRRALRQGGAVAYLADGDLAGHTALLLDLALDHLDSATAPEGYALLGRTLAAAAHLDRPAFRRFLRLIYVDLLSKRIGHDDAATGLHLVALTAGDQLPNGVTTALQLLHTLARTGTVATTTERDELQRLARSAAASLPEDLAEQLQVQQLVENQEIIDVR